MNLKKFATMAIMFTTATSVFMEPVSTITTVPRTVLAGTALAVSEDSGTAYAADTETGSSTTDTAGTSTDITAADTTDTNVVEKTDIEADNSTAEVTEEKTDNTEKKSSKSKAKLRKTKVKIQIAKAKARNNYSNSDLRLMSSIINCEAGIEPYQGKIAVGIVVMNRIKSKSFPNTLEGVIYQSGQFSPVRNGSLRKRLAQYDAGRIRSKQWKNCISAARKVLNGQRTIVYNGRTKNMSSYHFFSVGLRGARLSLGGHKFK